MKTCWDLTHLYLSQEDWEKDLKLLSDKINEVNSINYEVNIKFIKLILNKMSELEISIERLYCYQKRMIDLDIDNEMAKKKAAEALNFYSEIIAIHTKFENFIISNSKKVISLLSSKELASYERYIKLIIRKHEHISSNNTSLKLLSEIKNSYRNTLEKLNFNSIIVDGEEVKITKNNYFSLMKKECEDIRRRAYRNYSLGYAD